MLCVLLFVVVVAGGNWRVKRLEICIIGGGGGVTPPVSVNTVM